MNNKESTTPRPLTHKELSALYGVSWLTFQRWLIPFKEEIGLKNGHFYSARQVDLIFQRLGRPGV